MTDGVDVLGELVVPDGFDPEAVEAAVAQVRAVCGWHIAPQISERIWVDGPGGQLLSLPTLHLTGVDMIEQADPGWAAVTDFDWSQSGMLWRDAGWTGRYRGIRATISHGHASWPAELRAVILRIAKPGLTPEPIASATSDGTQINYRADSPPGVVDSYAAQILSRYTLT